ncbi:putative nuclease HARBI1 [Armigeres subalbatus]|uniref:putative nuclease HARBI1 n=1 Tax=Armigeres subalbatus TaxID=124917 RepID=UPI002ED186C3
MNKSSKYYKLFVRRDTNCNNYRSLYRFSEVNVKWLTEHFLNDGSETRGGALSGERQMRTFLRYIGDPGFQVCVGEVIGIHQTTASKTIWEVCQKIADKADRWIQFPNSMDAMKHAEILWSQNQKFPHTIGAIDCTHVAIIKPHTHGDEFINRKGIASFNVQATCNGQEIFTSIDCSWPGSVHDSRIWRNSAIHNIMHENSSGVLLLGDEGYGIVPWMMTAYRNPDTPVQLNYNKIHSRERVVIERVFGQVKRRFPILKSKIRIKTDRVPALILACFVLHNVAKHLGEQEFEDDFSDPIVLVPVAPVNENRSNTLKMRGDSRRDIISQYLIE